MCICFSGLFSCYSLPVGYLCVFACRSADHATHALAETTPGETATRTVSALLPPRSGRQGAAGTVCQAGLRLTRPASLCQSSVLGWSASHREYVLGGERERDRDRETDREGDTERVRERMRERQKQRHRESVREKETQRE